MAIIGCMTDSFKHELLLAVHDFANDTFKIALYDSTADIGPSTTAYTSTGEVTGTGYAAGGATLSGISITAGAGVAYVDWADPTWSGADFTARGALIYNTSESNKSVLVLDFGSNRYFNSSISETLRLPPGTRDFAILRLGIAR